MDDTIAASQIKTGVPGLDAVLRGGLPKDMIYLVHGGPGAGKTTLGFHFLLEGVRRGERVLLASLLQRPQELRRIAASHGWSLDGIDLLDLPESLRASSTDEQTMFSPAEVELHEVTEAIIHGIEKHRPQRLVFDSITELAVLVDNPHQLRRQMLKFKQRLEQSGCTSLFTANDTLAVDLPSLQTAVHGVIELGIERMRYGPPHRWLEATKMRGLSYLGGRHDIAMQTGGIEVYPRLEIPQKHHASQWSRVSSGNTELDALFGGGLEAGTACLLAGTTGAGKSTLASIYVQAAAQRGERCLIFCFDERRQTYIQRSKALELDIVEQIEQGLVDLRQIDFGNLRLGQFADELRTAIHQQDVRVVVIDSLTGLANAMMQEHMLIQLHELLNYLACFGVLTFLIVPTHGFGGASSPGLELDTSYIADTVVLMRHFEALGEVRRCISVIKKRHGEHEKSIREIHSGPGGMIIGPPLTEFRNVLSGTPQYIGAAVRLLDKHGESGGHA